MYLYKIDRNGCLNLLLNNQNNNNMIQSAGNCKKSSETIRQLSNTAFKDNNEFAAWLAGINDGGGNLDIRKENNKPVFKAIRFE
jgi:hypothetical protein